MTSSTPPCEVCTAGLRESTEYDFLDSTAVLYEEYQLEGHQKSQETLCVVRTKVQELNAVLDQLKELNRSLETPQVELEQLQKALEGLRIDSVKLYATIVEQLQSIDLNQVPVSQVFPMQAEIANLTDQYKGLCDKIPSMVDTLQTCLKYLSCVSEEVSQSDVNVAAESGCLGVHPPALLHMGVWCRSDEDCHVIGGNLGDNQVD